MIENKALEQINSENQLLIAKKDNRLEFYSKKLVDYINNDLRKNFNDE